jgi:hypothetical protein
MHGHGNRLKLLVKATNATANYEKRKLLLDDLRTVDMIYDKSEVDGFDMVRSYDDFVSYMKSNGLPRFISFESDLGLDANEEVAPGG